MTTASSARAAGTSRYLPTLVAGVLAVFTAQVAYSLPGSLNGTFQTYYGVTGAELTWITAVFAAAMVIFELTFGVFGDVFGRKRLLLGGLGLLAVGEVVSYFADGVHTLWVGQAIAGIGAGALYPISLTMIAALAPSAAVRARSIAMWAGFLSVGAAVSPLVAGALAENGSWKVSFWLIVGVAVVTFLVSLGAQDSSAPEGRGLDFPGQVTLVIGLVSLIWALTQGSEEGFGNTPIVVAFVLAAVFLAAFVAIELRTESPLVHLGLFKNRAFAITGVVAVIGMFAYLGACFSMSIVLGAVMHVSALKIGILFVIIQVPALVLVPVIAKLIHSVSPRWVLTVGFLFIAAGAIWASTFDAHTITWKSFIVPLLLVGVGFALTVASITGVAINAVPLRLAGMASATTNLLRDFGFALGPVVIAAIANSIANHKLVAGLDAAIGQGIADGSIPTDPALQGPFVGTITGISQQAGAVAINSMPVVPGQGAQAAPLGEMPFSVHDLAFTSLSEAYNTAYVVVAVCAVVAAALTAFGLIGTKAGGTLAAESEAAAEEQLATV